MGRANRLFGQTIGQAAGYQHLPNGSGFVDEYSHLHDSLDLVLARLLGIEGPRVIEQYRTGVDGRLSLKRGSGCFSEMEYAAAESSVATGAYARPITRPDPAVQSGADAAVLSGTR